MSKLDDISWHFGSDEFPPGLPEENAATHIGFFVAWAIRYDCWGDFLGANAAANVAAVKDGLLSGRTLVLEQCDGKLLTEMLKADIIPFAASYYEKQYLSDYQRVLVTGLQSDYHVDDSEANYQKMASVIGQRHEKWLARTKKPKWKFW